MSELGFDTKLSGIWSIAGRRVNQMSRQQGKTMSRAHLASRMRVSDEYMRRLIRSNSQVSFEAQNLTCKFALISRANLQV